MAIGQDKDSEKEKLKNLYSVVMVHNAWKNNNAMTAVDFWDQFLDCLYIRECRRNHCTML